MSGSYRFDRFLLDTDDRRLTRDGAAVDLNARYLDALTLLVRDGGALVTKDRFMAEVWRGVPVTDEALTQCVRTLRRLLGDDATHPRFIETVPKYGYRFVAPVTTDVPEAPVEIVHVAVTRPRPATWAIAGALGGAVAGAIGGVLYGFTFDAPSAQPGIGAASVLVVLLVVCALVGAAGGAGVGGGIAVARAVSRSDWRWAAVGGGLGGLVVGAVGRLLGLDAFALLLGRMPGDITGGLEGAALGTAVGVGGWLGTRLPDRIGLRITIAAVAGGVAGAAIGARGGRLMGGSLDLLAHGFAGSRLKMDGIGRLFGEADFGPVTRVVTAGFEGALFAACVVAAILLMKRQPATAAE